MKLVTADQMRAIEQSSVEAGVSLDELMENAGLAVAESVRDRWDTHNELFGKRIVVLVGPGNNGSDGLVAGRHLSKWGAKVTAALCAKRKTTDPKRELAESSGVEVVDATIDPRLDRLSKLLSTSDLVIDAVLGTGTSRPIDKSSTLASILFVVVESAVPVVAIDLPTGLNSDSGEFDIAGLPADETLMLGYAKLGAAIAPNSASLGDISVLDIRVPLELDSQITAELITEELALDLLPLRPPDGHKGTFGSTLIIAGSKQYLGAVTMAIEAAVRSGNGLTFVATPDSAFRSIVGAVPEAMYTSLPTDSDGELLASTAASTALDLANRTTAVVAGPGIGTSPATAEFLKTFLSQVDEANPLVLDADALNILSGTHEWWTRIPNPAVLTPHPGELGRLLCTSSEQIQSNRMDAVMEAAKKFDKVVILKGAATLIAAPDGRVNVSPWTNPGLAQGGSGDVLAGLLGGLLAQSPDELFEMASLAVFAHGYAAGQARDEYGETGMRPTDVIQKLGHFYRDFAQ